MRLRIDDSDHDERFAALLPREGRVVATPRSSDSRRAWNLVRLDAPLVYESVEYSHCLVASRWLDRPINKVQPTSVSILLVPAAGPEVTDGFACGDYLEIARAMAQLLDRERPAVAGPPAAAGRRQSP